jgi:hypothetical protein
MFVSVGPHFFYNPRIYTWHVDALDFPGSFQTLMRSILGSSPKYAYVVGHNSLPLGKMFKFDG